MTDKKRNRIPTISPDRVDETPGDTSVGLTKEERKAHAFVKGKEPAQPLTVRLPLKLHHELREIAFRRETKINHIVIKLIRDYIKTNKQHQSPDTAVS